MNEPTPKIRIRGLRKAFGGKLVLDGLDLDVGVGESVVVIGGSGSGKSVLSLSVMRLVPPPGRVAAGPDHPERRVTALAGALQRDGAEAGIVAAAITRALVLRRRASGRGVSGS